MVKSEIQWDALLLTRFEDFSTANGNFRGNTATTIMATQLATRRQRGGNARHTEQ
jgi:hypothetical protein